MNTPLHSPPTTAAVATSPVMHHPPRWQFSLRLMLLLMAAIGLWISVVMNWLEIPRLEKQVAALRIFSQELKINDPQRLAVVFHDPAWYDEFSWDLYVPPEGYEIALATRDIADDNFPASGQQARLPAGKCRLSLVIHRQPSDWKMSLARDGEELLSITEPRAWNPDLVRTGGPNFRISAQPDLPAALLRQRFFQRLGGGSAPVVRKSQPENGVLLWIEAEPAARRE